MKDQYFADERDFLKYDLWIEIAEKLGHASLTFIPMLTPRDGTKQGNKTRYEPGERRRELYEFLQSCLKENKRSIIQLRKFFELRMSCGYHPYRDGASGDADYFDSGRRAEYFAGIPAAWLADSAILLDPDTGLQTKGRYWKERPERYVLYADAVGIAKQGSGRSVIMLVQFPQLNADRRKKDLQDRAQRFSQELMSTRAGEWRVHWVAQGLGNGNVGELAFFILTPNSKDREGIESLLDRYAERHRLVWK